MSAPPRAGPQAALPGAGATNTPPRPRMAAWGGEGWEGRAKGPFLPGRRDVAARRVGARPRPRERRGEGASWRGRRVMAALPGAGRGSWKRWGGGPRAKSWVFPPYTPGPRGCDGCRRAQSGQGRNCVNLSRWEGAKGHRSLTTSAKWSLQQSKIKPESLSPFSRSENRSGGSLGLGMRRGEGTAPAGRARPRSGAAGSCRSCHAAAEAPRGRAGARKGGDAPWSAAGTGPDPPPHPRSAPAQEW